MTEELDRFDDSRRWQPYRIVAMGTPCGGTINATNLLKHRGFVVGHEVPCRQGMVCGFGTWANEEYRPRQQLFERPKLLIHIMRHPLPVSETLPYYLAWEEKESGIMHRAHPQDIWIDDAQLRALRYWVHTHELILAMHPDRQLVIGPRYLDQASELLRDLGRHPSVPDACKRGNSKPASNRWERMTWRRWHRTDSEYASRAERILEATGVTDADGKKPIESPLAKVLG